MLPVSDIGATVEDAGLSGSLPIGLRVHLVASHRTHPWRIRASANAEKPFKTGSNLQEVMIGRRRC